MALPGVVGTRAILYFGEIIKSICPATSESMQQQRKTRRYYERHNRFWVCLQMI